MALTPRAFSGSTFFSAIRAQMNKNRGFFGGMDGAFKYVCMDASFYRFLLLIRPGTSSFTDFAAATPTNVRAIANGQMFRSYCYASPCTVDWQGRVMQAGTLVPGGTSTPGFRHFAQWTGCSELSFAVAKGNPESVTPTYFSAMGRLLPLVQNKLGSPPGPLGTFWAEPAETGKIVYGLARAEQVVFMLAQENGEDGLDVKDLIKRLVSMKVDEAVMGDGSSSVMLSVDHVLEVDPGYVKDNSIPVGPMFQLHSFKLVGSRSMTNTPATTDAQLQPPITVTGTAGNLSLTNTGMLLSITSLGTSTGIATAALVSRLGITLPLNLKATTSLITSEATFAAPDVSAALTLVPTNTSDGHLTGTLTFTTGHGIAQFNVDWQVGDA